MAATNTSMLAAEVLTVDGADTVSEVARRLASERQTAALIISPTGTLKGIFTESDIVVRVVGAGKDAATTAVSEVMTADPIAVDEETAPDVALALMQKRKFRHLPVVRTLDGSAVGCVDILAITGAICDSDTKSSWLRWRFSSALNAFKSKTIAFSEQVLVIQEGTSVSEAAELMASRKASALLVTAADTGLLVGIFTEADLVRRVVAADLRPESTAVGDVMTKNPTCASPFTSPHTAFDAMRKGHYRHLPVVRHGQPVGLLDILHLTSDIVISEDASRAASENQSTTATAAESSEVASGSKIKGSGDAESAATETASDSTRTGTQASVLRRLAAALSSFKNPNNNNTTATTSDDTNTDVGAESASSSNNDGSATSAPAANEASSSPAEPATPAVSTATAPTPSTETESNAPAEPAAERITIKFTYESRKVRASCDKNYTAVLETVSQRTGVPAAHIELRYLDDEGDEIDCVNDGDVAEAADLAAEMGWKALKIVVVSNEPEPATAVPATGEAVATPATAAAASEAPQMYTKMEEQGNIKLQESAFESALGLFARALELLPAEQSTTRQLAVARLNTKCGHVNLILGDLDAAMTSFSAAIGSVDSASPATGLLGEIVDDARSGLVRIHTENRDYVAAVNQILACSSEEAKRDSVEHMVGEQTRLKESGNESFKTASFMDAMGDYTSAILVNIALTQDSGGVLGVEEDCKLYSNRAATYMAMGDYTMALSDCDKCLEIDSSFVKGYVRKGRAIEGSAAQECLSGAALVDALSRAHGVFTAGLELDPTHPALRADSARLRGMIDSETAKISVNTATNDENADPAPCTPAVAALKKTSGEEVSGIGSPVASGGSCGGATDSAPGTPTTDALAQMKNLTAMMSALSEVQPTV